MATGARILIVGAGVGGLTLAHALRGAGFDVAVYERDPSARIRTQGYRIHIDGDGNEALAACLPAEVLDLVVRGSGRNGDRVAGYTHRLQELFAQTFPLSGDDQITNVDRQVFRQGLLTGLDDVIHFGRPVAGFERLDSGRVAATFEDGDRTEGDLLVGADGVHSVVRRQLLPHATVNDLGVRCLYGRMPLTEETAGLVPDDFDRGFSWAADDTGYGAGFAPVRFRTPQPGASDYLMTVLTATPRRLGLADEELYRLPAPELWKLTVEATADWHPTVREIFAHADPASFFPITIRAGRRVDAWDSAYDPGNVTLLGDAIHTMPPTGGVGANTALWDASTLTRELVSAGRGDQTLLGAVRAYEAAMLPHGFDIVDRSVRMAEEMFATST